MATGQGTAVLNFGAWPGSNEASVLVTGQAAILTTSKAEAYVMAGDSTGDKTANDHRYFAALAGLTCDTPTAATGFTIHARSLEALEGSFACRYVWAD